MMEIAKIPEANHEMRMLKVIRELALDMRPLADILETHKVTQDEFDHWKDTALFQSRLQSEIEDWNAAVKTSDRVRLKSLYMIEEALPEFYGRLHDAKETLPAKTELLKAISKLAGLGERANDGAGMGEKLSVVINLGSDHQLRIEKDVTSKVIDDETVKS